MYTPVVLSQCVVKLVRARDKRTVLFRRPYFRASGLPLVLLSYTMCLWPQRHSSVECSLFCYVYKRYCGKHGFLQFSHTFSLLLLLMRLGLPLEPNAQICLRHRWGQNISVSLFFALQYPFSVSALVYFNHVNHLQKIKFPRIIRIIRLPRCSIKLLMSQQVISSNTRASIATYWIFTIVASLRGDILKT